MKRLFFTSICQVLLVACYSQQLYINNITSFFTNDLSVINDQLINKGFYFFGNFPDDDNDKGGSEEYKYIFLKLNPNDTMGLNPNIETLTVLREDNVINDIVYTKNKQEGYLGFKNNLISSGFKLVGESQKNENYGFNTLYENEKYKVMIVLSPLKWEIFVSKK